ncbi:MAG: polyprenyl synthetase family protein [Candidatus Zixiibacteriota bacterium]
MKLDLILSPVKKKLSSFEEKLKDSLNSDSPLISEVAYHLLSLKGKRLRPALVFLSFGLCGNSNLKSQNSSHDFRANSCAMNVALAIELIHNATLLHDDVIDQSQFRRGQVSVNHKWNNLVSVLMGDFLLANAFKLLVKTESRSLLSSISKATEQVSIGEMNQIQESYNFKLDEKTYLQIIAEKTASLFAASCESGAIAADADQKSKELLKNYGLNLGMAFQITDDLLDWIGQTEKTGKGLGNDLKEGKITLPLIHTLREADRSSRKKIFGLLENDFNQRDFNQILSFIKGNGGVEYSRQKAKSFGEEALSQLSDLKDSEYKQALENLVGFVIKRDK